MLSYFHFPLPFEVSTHVAKCKSSWRCRNSHKRMMYLWEFSQLPLRSWLPIFSSSALWGRSLLCLSPHRCLLSTLSHPLHNESPNLEGPEVRQGFVHTDLCFLPAAPCRVSRDPPQPKREKQRESDEGIRESRGLWLQPVTETLWPSPTSDQYWCLKLLA